MEKCDTDHNWGLRVKFHPPYSVKVAMIKKILGRWLLLLSLIKQQISATNAHGR